MAQHLLLNWLIGTRLPQFISKENRPFRRMWVLDWPLESHDKNDKNANSQDLAHIGAQDFRVFCLRNCIVSLTHGIFLCSKPPLWTQCPYFPQTCCSKAVLIAITTTGNACVKIHSQSEPRSVDPSSVFTALQLPISLGNLPWHQCQVTSRVQSAIVCLLGRKTKSDF